MKDKYAYEFKKNIEENSRFYNKGVKVEVDGHDSDLDNLLEAFEDFLYACGFRFDGRVDIVKEEVKEDE